MSEEVIELSIEETNRLRADLGLAPLRMSPAQRVQQGGAGTEETSTGDQEEILEMSVDETNKLREKLGMPPLRSSSQKQDVHKPAANDRAASEVAERIAQAKLKREVEAGVAQTFGDSTLAEDAGNSALSWAEQMRKNKAAATAAPTTEKSKSSKKQKSTSAAVSGGEYDEKDLDGLQVAHNLNDLEAGTTTVLTLADAPLLSQSLDDKTSRKLVGLNEGGVALENVNLTESKKQQDGLRKKRLLEMGMGRAGGYAGFDDDEFEELGGTLGPAKRERGNTLLGGGDPMDDDEGGDKLSRGFRIGGSKDANQESSMTDFDKMQTGKAISLVPVKADLAASDYMTLEEEEAERAMRRKKKDGKFKKKKKKKDKKRRKTQLESDDEEEQDEDAAPDASSNGAKSNLLEQLEETAMPTSSGLRKRRRTDDDDEGEVPVTKTGFVSVKQENGEMIQKKEKRTKYDEIMAKGNERTQKAFADKTKSKQSEESVLDEEPDDSFLNAALAKARRLNRLRDMNKPAKGADAVAESVKSMSKEHHSNGESASAGSSGGITFVIDDTREFTLALQARAQQKEREAEKAKQQRATAKANQVVVKKEEDATTAKEAESKEVLVETAEEEDVDMEELAKEVKTDDLVDTGFDGSTSRSAGVGRGLSSFVSMLKTTGEISKKAGTEELKGRAKDERNYDNYAPVDLSQVVKIGRNATDKDRELANREIKLEYRDKHGRLLTTKEAYRDLCYQFHGHGGGKKKEEKRLKQIEREQAQARMASRSVAAARDGTAAGTLGALKATQKATGKAFIVHKTS